MTEAKRILRAEFEAKRRRLSHDAVEQSGREVQKHFMAWPVYSAAKVAALYAAQSFEVPTVGLANAWLAMGRTVVFPRVDRPSRILKFYSVSCWDDLIAQPNGLLEPRDHPNRFVAIDRIDLFVVPGVAFTKNGDRLGRGGGYYDATLQQKNDTSLCVGLAFEVSWSDQLPTEVHDVRMDGIITETGVHSPIRR